MPKLIYDITSILLIASVNTAIIAFLIYVFFFMISILIALVCIIVAPILLLGFALVLALIASKYLNF